MEKRIQLSDKILTYLVFFIIYCTDAAIVNTNNARIWARIAWLGILFLTFIFVPKARYTNNDKIYLGVFSLSILASMFVNEGLDVNFIQRVVLLWTSLAIVTIVEYNRLMIYYIKIMRFIAIFSMVCFVLSPILVGLPLPRMYSGDMSYISLFFSNISMDINRNFGPFWEPGAFQLYLNWAVFYELRNMKQLRMSDILIFALCIITTQSTGGIAIFAMILGYHLFFSKHSAMSIELYKWTNKLKALIIIMIMAAIMAFVTIPELYQSVFGKIIALQENSEEINSANVSSMTRILSVPACIDAIKSRPIFGWGIEGLKDEILETYNITSNTNSILGLAATFGLLPGFLYLWLFIKMVYVQSKSLLGRILLFLILCVMFSTENLICSFFFWCVLFYESRKKVIDKGYV